MGKLIALLFLVSCIFGVSDATEKSSWFQNMCSGTNEKVAKIHFYAHVVMRGLNRNVYEVARASITSSSPTQFGLVEAVDELLTAEPAYNSETVGRGQGLVTSADLETSALAMNINYYFTSGKYKGSTISILGRNQVRNSTREMAVAGGTGVFRGARGYAIASTYFYDVGRYGVFEYTLYVTDVDDSKRASTGGPIICYVPMSMYF